MNGRVAGILVAAIAALLAGCGGGHSSVVPLPVASAAHAGTGPKASVSFTIIVPKKATAQKPAYVSPATQSMTVNIMQGSTSVISETVGLTPTSTGCTSTLTSTQCTLQLSLTAGAYTASITTYDGTNATGNALSTAQAVAFTVVQGQNNVVPLTLSGIPAQVLPNYAGNGQFYVAALDVDGNYIIGPGAPTFSVAKSSGSTVVSITQPSTTAPNAFELSATTDGSETLTITAGYGSGETNGCAQPGAVCSTSFSVTGTQYVFFTNEDDSNILGFVVPFTSATASPIFTGSAYYPENAITIDASENVFYAGDEYTAVPVDEISPPYTGSPVAGPSVSGYVYGLAVGSNGDLFVLSYDNEAVYVYAPPYTGSAIATITAGIDDAESIALDANNDLFVGNDGSTANITEYAPPYTESTATATISTTVGTTIYYPETLFFDASGDLWLADESDSSVLEYTPTIGSSSTPAVTITNGIGEPSCPGVFDASGNLFIANYSADTITEYTKASGYSLAATITDDFEPCGLVMDKAGDLYSVNDTNTTGSGEGAILEFTPPYSGSSAPVYQVSTGVYYPYDAHAVITNSVNLTVSL